MHSTKSKAKQLLAGFVGVALALSFVAGAALPAGAATVEELTAQINSLLGTIAALQAQLSTIQGGGSATPAGYVFTSDLTVGSKGEAVVALQQILVSKGYLVMPSGVAMGYFGNLTKMAVAKWQAAAGISPAAGYVGPKSRAALNAMGSVSTGTGTGTTPTPVGAGIAVSASVQQPGAQLAPSSAARVPFTKVTLTAGSSDVVVNNLTVTRTGPAQDIVFAGIVLLDENGMQLGVAKTLNSNHQVTVGDPFTVKAGTSKTVTIAGNMASSLASYAGQVATLTVSAVNTSATVTGALPITGTPQTINGTLTVGTVTVNVSTFDPSSASTQNIGTTGYRFAGLRLTAGSAEDVRLWSVRWNQSGSASASDLANIVTVVDGVQYPTTVSSDGKYYTTTFGNGIVIAKGFSKDVYVQGDIVGSGAAGRTVQFDLYKTTDIYLSGETYGYGITPPAGSGSSSTATTITSTNPWFDGSLITVAAGSVTTVTNATTVAAQNIAVNVPNQVLGGYATDIKGEPISVQQSVFTIASSSGSGYGLLTSVSVVNENGAVVAGPVDAQYTNSTTQTVTFTDTITYPTGKHVYTLKGKVASTIGNGTIYAVSTTPSSGWTVVTGQTTGNNISLSALSSAVTSNPMTVKSAALAVNVSSNPAAQTVIAGSVGFVFANYQFDASQSGEDVRFSSVPLTLTAAGGAAVTDLTGCQLWNGSTALNTGSNVVNPSAAAATFTLDQSLTIPKGTVVTVALSCNIRTGVSGTYNWGVTSTQIGNISVTGVTSSNSVTATGSTATGPTMTVGTASLAVSTDASTPGYTVVPAGSTGVNLGVLKFRATNDAVNLQRVVLKLTNTASSSAADLVQVTLWSGSTQIGTAVFTGTNATATSTLSTPLTLAKDTDVAVTVKGDLSMIGSSQPVTLSGHLVAVDFQNNDSTGTYGTGVGSGTTVNATGSTAFAGVRVFKSYPTVAAGTGLSTNGVADGRLLRFAVTANSAGPVGVAKFTVTLATSSASVTNLNLFGYTDSSYSQPVSGVNTGGQLMSSNYASLSSAPTVSFYPQTTAGATTTIQVPAGQTRYFELRGTVAAASGATSYSVTATLNGDSAFPAQAGGLTATSTTAAWVDGGGAQYSSNRSFIWSPNSTTTSSVVDVDWTNGYGLPGLPSSGIIQTRSN